MLKEIGIVIGSFSILFPILTSFLDDGKFRSSLGACPTIKGRNPIDIGRLEGQWYTHWVGEKFLPWHKVQCLKHRVTVDSNNELHLRSLFKLLNIPFEFELKANIDTETDDGHLDVTFFNSTFGNLLRQRFTVVKSDPSGAALLWTCIDLKLIHFELATVMTKYDDLKDRHVDKEIFETIESTVKQLGFPIKYVSEIDQSRC